MKSLRRKWYFWPLVVVYLSFGVWLGSVSYRVDHNPENYSYSTRFAFFPTTTIFREGAGCDRREGCSIPFSAKYNSGLTLGTSGNFYQPKLSKDQLRANYILVLALGWPVKVIVNLVIIILFLVTMIVYGFCGVFMAVIAMISSLLVRGFSLLL